VQLYRWCGSERNFGDELNRLLWPCLLPDFFDDDAAVLFLGIGSVLDARHPADAVKLVAGAGYGGYESSPAIDARWVIHWVRGPRTARVLRLPTTCGLGDPAILLPVPSADGGRAIGFMPHFESLGRGAWAEAAVAAGMTLIDPRDDPDAIIAAIRTCRLLRARLCTEPLSPMRCACPGSLCVRWSPSIVRSGMTGPTRLTSGFDSTHSPHHRPPNACMHRAWRGCALVAVYSRGHRLG
jgi:hypothetical protein